jgi:CDP-diacylglycerol--glycerol-3-phosphate 3-phosphatidyltransferase
MDGMMAPSRMNLPNIITVARIAACPVIFVLALSPSTVGRFAAFVLFLAASLSDLWDGYLARKHGLITDFGKLLDPLADKFLLVATFIPFFILSHQPGEMWHLPWWGPLPVWVMIVIFGREVAVTAFRSYAVGLLLWYPLKMAAMTRGWSGWFWTAWGYIHGSWIGVTLTVAIILTVYSMLDYFWSYRSLVGARP